MVLKCAISNLCVTLARKLTNCLRVIRNAWHFYYALVLVFKVVCGGIGIALLTP
ncbi:DUF3265 domain-containing protein [Vibrio vulnificus]|nr:hypothetical protein VVMO6_01415 [Vibrio vulnificus MO6-24/O]EGR0040760.1 DUF3265 domain-containing protein [Vibrio vulnificus]EGR0093572.1 DUF3265 domain-containing protein [Vibrio vulnificus]EGR0097963.1 DUF3265 domain-containing protein [Vibrio vulnificus]EGR1425821.1 DUF3265 domain-containing protein [Vibrio vulnificus]